MGGLADRESSIRAAAVAIREADALLIGAGAGMGVDSGLPDFRGPEGFWKAYPPFRGRRFAEMSTPHWFQTDPALAWGFFGHRLNLYRSTIPHRGFQILRQWGERLPLGCFVYTSNVDGQFQKAGYSGDAVVEIHGSIHHLQCTRPCTGDVWSASDLQLEVDESTIRVKSEFPRCPGCGVIARPNILMFGDGQWISDRTGEQHDRFCTFTTKGDRILTWDGKDIIETDTRPGGKVIGKPHPVDCGEPAQLLLAADDRRLVAVGTTGALLMDRQLGWRPAPISGHRSRITRVAFNPSGSMMATVDAGGTIRLREMTFPDREGEELKDHTGAIRDLQFTPDGEILIAAGADGLFLWKVPNPKRWW